MMEPVTIDLRKIEDVDEAERLAIEHLEAGRRVVVLMKVSGVRKLLLNAVPGRESIAAIREHNVGTTRYFDAPSAVRPTFNDARRGFKDPKAYLRPGT